MNYYNNPGINVSYQQPYYGTQTTAASEYTMPQYPNYRQNPYGQPFRQQPTPQYQAPQNTIAPLPLQGRTVQSAEEITPNEVPMDSSVSFFPLADGSAIIAKTWASDGTIKTFRYVMEQPITQDSENQNESNLMITREQMVDDIVSKVTDNVKNQLEAFFNK